MAAGFVQGRHGEAGLSSCALKHNERPIADMHRSAEDLRYIHSTNRYKRNNNWPGLCPAWRDLLAITVPVSTIVSASPRSLLVQVYVCGRHGGACGLPRMNHAITIITITRGLSSMNPLLLLTLSNRPNLPVVSIQVSNCMMTNFESLDNPAVQLLKQACTSCLEHMEEAGADPATMQPGLPLARALVATGLGSHTVPHICHTLALPGLVSG